MANFGKSEYSFGKPYLNLLAKDIMSKNPVKIGAKKIVIKQNDPVKKLLKEIEKGSQNGVEKLLKLGSGYAPIFEDSKTGNLYKWSEIDKSPYSGMGGGQIDAKTTAMQERCSLYAIEMGLKVGGYKDKKKFLKDCTDEIVNLYPKVDSDWMDTFFEQQKKTCAELGRVKFTHFSRDGGFMDFITDLVKAKYGISKKDSWNPADIWLVNNLEKNKKILISAADGPISQFNAVLREMYWRNEVVGISLKKMSGKTARWEEVNLNEKGFKSDFKYHISAVKSHISVSGGKFKTTDTVITISDKNSIYAVMQVRQNTKGISNLKFEATAKGAGAARMGKVPLDMLSSLMDDYGLSLNNSHKMYPKTTADFEKQKTKFYDQYIRMEPHAETSINKTEFYENMVSGFNGDPTIAMSKLMQIDFMSQLFSLSPDKISDLITSMLFLSQKKGAVFGPFAKLY